VRAQQIIATGWVRWATTHGHGNETAPPRATKPTPPPGGSSGPNKPVADVNCSDFSTHAAAQSWFEQQGGSASNDVAGLDHDHDGLACESPP
jgi:hypothetical protein